MNVKFLLSSFMMSLSTSSVTTSRVGPDVLVWLPVFLRILCSYLINLIYYDLSNNYTKIVCMFSKETNYEEVVNRRTTISKNNNGKKSDCLTTTIVRTCTEGHRYKLSKTPHIWIPTLMTQYCTRVEVEMHL